MVTLSNILLPWLTRAASQQAQKQLIPRAALYDRYETLGFEKRDRSHLFQTEMEDRLVEDTGRYYR